MTRCTVLVLCVAGAATSAAAGGVPSGARPLTPAEIRSAFIGHTWSAPATGRPGVMSAAERKLYDGWKGSHSGRFKEYYAPGGSITGRVDRPDFTARVDGTWRISGNTVCASYNTHRVWAAGGLAATAHSSWCYSFVYKGGSLLMAASRTPSAKAGEAGQYFRPSLTPGNTVGH